MKMRHKHEDIEEFSKIIHFDFVFQLKGRFRQVCYVDWLLRFTWQIQSWFDVVRCSLEALPLSSYLQLPPNKFWEITPFLEQSTSD